MSDKSFDKIIVENTSRPLIRANREYQFNKQQNYELNTYATWGETANANDFLENYTSSGNKQNVIGSSKSKLGVKSLFNKYAIVFKSDDIRISNNVPLIDTPENRKNIKKNSDCSIKNLVNSSKLGILGSSTYDYSDFAYCKYLGKMPNNYMITLRRFPIAVNDYIKPIGSNKFPNTTFGNPNTKGSYVPPVSLGCLVTWMGTPGNEIENILTYSYNIPYEQIESALHDDTKDDQKNPLNALFSAFDPRYQKAVEKGMVGNAISPLVGNMFGGYVKEGLEDAPYFDHLRSRGLKKISGPIDSIQDTHKRSSKGLKFNHSFSLTFEYELRAYNNINTRQAMLDLLANVLAVTYQAGDFFPGTYRALGAPQSDVFSNLRIMQTSGGISAFVDAFHEDIQTILSRTSSYIEKNGGVVETVKDLANTFGGMIIGGLLNKFGRPQKNALNSLLSPAPVGLWHVMVGNPFHPIMSIGNMILEETSITHTGPLGLDDFPTGLKVVCKLTRAKGRDKRDIEKLYMHGINRVYAHMGTEVDKLYKSAPEYKGSDKTVDTYQVNPETLSGIKQEYISETAKNNDVYVRYFGTNYMDALKLASGEISYGSQKKSKNEK